MHVPPLQSALPWQRVISPGLHESPVAQLKPFASVPQHGWPPQSSGPSHATTAVPEGQVVPQDSVAAVVRGMQQWSLPVQVSFGPQTTEMPSAPALPPVPPPPVPELLEPQATANRPVMTIGR